MINTQKSKKIIQIFLTIEHTLDPFDRFIFLRLWLIDPDDQQRDPLTLNSVAEKLKVGREKLKKSLSVLSKKGLVSLQQDHQIIINNLFDLPLKKKCQLFELDKFLISNIDRCRYHHKQKAIKNYWNLDYKAWLVLFLLILHSDKNGIVIKIGMHEFNIYTGMDRYSVQRTLNKLFSFGILRSKLNGTLDSEYLSFTSAIYFLNLSHPLWGEHRKYQQFKFLSLPSQFNFFEQGLFVIENITKIYQGKIDKPIFPFLFKTQEDNIFTIQKMNNLNFLLANYPYHLLDTVNIVERKKWKIISLKSTKNKENNLNRLEFMFKYLVQSLEISVNFIKKYMFFAKRYFKVNEFELFEKDHTKSILNMWPDMQQALEEGQFQLYAFLSQLLMRNTILALDKTTNNHRYPTIIPVPVFHSDWDGYVMPSIDLREDELYEISLIEEGRFYKRTENKIEMTIENQKKYGLLHTSCEALKF